MFELFPDQPAYDFPTFVNVAYALGWAFILSSLIAIVHKITFKGNSYPKSFFQSMVLGSLVTGIVMMAIGDNLARGLGVFGAMAIIRFRTRISDPRDVIFLFAALSTGLAVGVFGYTVAFIGAIIFCLIALGLHFSPFTLTRQSILLAFTLGEGIELAHVFSCIESSTSEYEIKSIASGAEEGLKYQITCVMKAGVGIEQLINQLVKEAGVNQVKVSTVQPSRF